MLFDGLELPADLKKAEVITRVNGLLQGANLGQNTARTRWGIEWLFSRDEIGRFKYPVLGHELEVEDAILKLLAIAPAKIIPAQWVPAGGYFIQPLKNPILVETYRDGRKIAEEKVSQGMFSFYTGERVGERKLRIRPYKDWSFFALVGYFPLAETKTGANKILWPTLR